MRSSMLYESVGLGLACSRPSAGNVIIIAI